MHHREFLARIDEKSVVAAIREAELRTSGEIRVFVSHHRVAEPLELARRQFRRLGMNKTKERNAILIFVAPKSQTFSLVGDVGIDEKCGAEFWGLLRDELVPRFKAGDFTAALVHAIRKAGEKLSEHFPAGEKPTNKLPDGVARD